MDTFQHKYKVVDFKWGYIIASFETLKAALNYVSMKGMRADHKRGETTIYAAR
jgi:hypothetical protein